MPFSVQWKLEEQILNQYNDITVSLYVRLHAYLKYVVITNNFISNAISDNTGL